MATPQGDSYSAASGVTIYGGRTAVVLPIWATSATVDRAISIANTAGFGGSPRSFSGWWKKGTTLGLSLAAGHSAGYDNRVVTLEYMQNAPVWTVRIPSSTTFTPDTPFYPDGKPAATHVYQMAQYVAALDCVVHAAMRFTHPNAGTFTNCHALDMSSTTLAWKTAGYVQNAPGQNGGGVIDYDGVFHAGIFSFKLDPVTRQWVSGTVSGFGGYSAYGLTRHPWATDVTGRKVVGISVGDNEGANLGTGLNASVMRNNLVYPINIASSAARIQIIADAAQYVGMDYDSINQKFLIVDMPNRRLYWLTVANDNTGTLSFYSPDLSGVTLPTQAPNNNDANTNTCVTFDPVLKGFFIGTGGVDLIFIKTST